VRIKAIRASLSSLLPCELSSRGFHKLIPYFDDDKISWVGWRLYLLYCSMYPDSSSMELYMVFNISSVLPYVSWLFLDGVIHGVQYIFCTALCILTLPRWSYTWCSIYLLYCLMYPDSSSMVWHMVFYACSLLTLPQRICTWYFIRLCIDWGSLGLSRWSDTSLYQIQIRDLSHSKTIFTAT
jgi:hypothetical protein